MWSLSPWLLAVAALTAFVLLGLRSAGAPPDAWLALLESPRFLAWKALTYTTILAGFDPHRRDQEEARTLYEILMHQVIPLYYRRANGSDAGNPDAEADRDRARTHNIKRGGK